MMKFILIASILCINVISGSDQGIDEKRMVVVDVDAGADDAIALLMLLNAHKRGQIQLKAITCVAGNTNLENVVTNVMRLLEAASALDIPVYRGAAEALVPRPDYNLDDDHHGIDGFGDLDYGGKQPDMSLIKKEHAVEAIYRLVSENPGKVTALFLGPATNAALVIKMHPDFVDLVKDIFVMGGSYKGVGNKSNAAEFNFVMDPEGIYLLLRKAKKQVVIMPWETCNAINITVDWRFDVMGAIDNPEMRLMNKVDRSVQNMYPSTIFSACDAACVAVMLDPSVVDESFNIGATVEMCARLTTGMIVLDHNGWYKTNAMIVTEMNVGKFKEMLMLAAGHDSAGL